MTQRNSCHFLLTIGLAGLIWGGQAEAQRADDDDGGHVDRFTNSYWSQSRPDQAYLSGCVTGYRAFQFSNTGYFVFDRRIRGTWRVDRFDNLILKTRDGISFKLFFDHGRTLTPNANNAIVRRDQRFQECRE